MVGRNAIRNAQLPNISAARLPARLPNFLPALAARMQAAATCERHPVMASVVQRYGHMYYHFVMETLPRWVVSVECICRELRLGSYCLQRGRLERERKVTLTVCLPACPPRLPNIDIHPCAAAVLHCWPRAAG